MVYGIYRFFNSHSPHYSCEQKRKHSLKYSTFCRFTLVIDALCCISFPPCINNLLSFLAVELAAVTKPYIYMCHTMYYTADELGSFVNPMPNNFFSFFVFFPFYHTTYRVSQPPRTTYATAGDIITLRTDYTNSSQPTYDSHIDHQNRTHEHCKACDPKHWCRLEFGGKSSWVC